MLLGGEDLNVHLNNAELDLCIDRALQKYRQRAQNATSVGYFFLQMEAGESSYILPKEIVSVDGAYRRGVGSVQSFVYGSFGSGGPTLDPFDVAFTNIYLLQMNNPGGLTTYEIFSGYIGEVMRMFGGNLIYHFDRSTRRITIVRNIKGNEIVLLKCSFYKFERQLLSDYDMRPWLQNYALAEAKMMLGTKYSKFASLPGPQGGITLNGDALKAEAKEEMEKLENDLDMYVDGSQPPFIVVG
jgi:hypothetical protein